MLCTTSEILLDLRKDVRLIGLGHERVGDR